MDYSKNRRLRPGETLYRAGDRADNAYLILVGAVKIFGPTGILLGTLKQGDILGEYSFADKKIRSVTAINDNLETILKVIPGHVISAKINENQFVPKILHQVEERLRLMNRKIDFIAARLNALSTTVDNIEQSELLKLSKFLGIRNDLRGLSKNMKSLPDDAQQAFEGSGLVSSVAELDQEEFTFSNVSKSDESEEDTFENILRSSRLYEVDGHEAIEDNIQKNWENRSDLVRIDSFLSRAETTQTTFGMFINDAIETILIRLVKYSKTDNSVIFEISDEQNKVPFSQIENELFLFSVGISVTIFGTIDDRFIRINTKVLGKSTKYQDDNRDKRVMVVRVASPTTIQVHLGHEYRRFRLGDDTPPVNVKLFGNDRKIRTRASIIALDGFEVLTDKKPNVDIEVGYVSEAELNFQSINISLNTILENIVELTSKNLWKLTFSYKFNNHSDEDKSARLVAHIERAKIKVIKQDT